ncbi:MAG: hypothetical protein JKX79_07495 [Labilibaculum sp.]|nr:hypothetical protein [Labilibaculum sp.]
MLKRLLYSTVLFCIISIHGFSQEKIIWKDYPNLGIMQYTVILNDTPIEENIYHNPQFKPSKLTTTENTELNSIKIRYNVKEDVMECKIGSQHSIIKSPEKLKEININGQCFEYKKYLVKKDITSGYLQRLSQGNQKIYAKHFISATKNEWELSKLKSYYLLQNKGELPRKLNSVKSFISHSFRNLIKQAHDFEKSNQLNLNKPQDLKKLLTYLGNLSKDIVTSR